MIIEIGKSIRILRQLRLLKQKELAEKAKISQSHLCEFEAAKKTPSLEQLERVSSSLGLSMSNMLLFHELIQQEWHDSKKALSILSAMENAS